MSDFLDTAFPLDFLDGDDPVRSAAPNPADREPAKRNQPPTPPPEPVKQERNPAAFTAGAIETWQRAQQLEIDVQGVLPCLIGHMPGDASVHDTLPGHWRPPIKPEQMRDDHEYDPIVLNGELHYQQCPPMDCDGAVYADSDEGRHLVRAVTEASAQREYLRALGTGITGLSRSRIARERMGRR